MLEPKGERRSRGRALWHYNACPISKSGPLWDQGPESVGLVLKNFLRLPWEGATFVAMLLRDDDLEHVWAKGAAEQLITLLQRGQHLDYDVDGRGTLRSHLTFLQTEIERALGER